MLARVGFVFADENISCLVEPRRNAMSPPQLPAHAPILDVVEPLCICRAPVLRHEFDIARTHRVQRGLGDCFLAAGPRLAVDTDIAGQIEEPLIGQHRLDHRIAALADRHLQFMLLRFDEQAERLQIGEHRLAGGEAIHAAIFFRSVVGNLGVQRQNDERREFVTGTDLPIVEIVRRRDLHRAGAEFAIDIVVGYDRDFASRQRKFEFLADKRGVDGVYCWRKHHR